MPAWKKNVKALEPQAPAMAPAPAPELVPQPGPGPAPVSLPPTPAPGPDPVVKRAPAIEPGEFISRPQKQDVIIEKDMKVSLARLVLLAVFDSPSSSRPIRTLDPYPNPTGLPPPRASASVFHPSRSQQSRNCQQKNITPLPTVVEISSCVTFVQAPR